MWPTITAAVLAVAGQRTNKRAKGSISICIRRLLWTDCMPFVHWRKKDPLASLILHPLRHSVIKLCQVLVAVSPHLPMWKESVHTGTLTHRRRFDVRAIRTYIQCMWWYTFTTITRGGAERKVGQECCFVFRKVKTIAIKKYLCLWMALCACMTNMSLQFLLRSCRSNSHPPAETPTIIFGKANIEYRNRTNTHAFGYLTIFALWKSQYWLRPTHIHTHTHTHIYTWYKWKNTSAFQLRPLYNSLFTQFNRFIQK